MNQFFFSLFYGRYGVAVVSIFFQYINKNVDLLDVYVYNINSERSRKENIMSQITKRALEASLKNLLLKSPLIK